VKALLRAGLLWPARYAVDVTLALLYVALLLGAGMIPLKSLPDPGFVPADKFWHLLAFGGLALLSFRALRHREPRVRRANASAAAFSIAVGGLLEVLQSFSSYRSAELLDLLADALGALLAFFGIAWLSPPSLLEQVRRPSA
jgi:VanZ family protein